MPGLPLLDHAALYALAQRSAAVDTVCSCAAHALSSWCSIPLSFPEAQLDLIGTLRADPFTEPSFAEYHPQGTRYDAADAPVAPRYFPYNRCDVAACVRCGRCYLRYDETGGYFFDRRIRALSQPALLIDAADPDGGAG